MASLACVPQEIVRRICQLVYLDSIPFSTLQTLDPYDLPPPEHAGQHVTASVDETQHYLYALCLVNRAFYREAQPLLLRRVQITLPYRFLGLLDLARGPPASPAVRTAPPLELLRVLDFSTFRALGLRRTVGESHERRFVTPERLLAMVRAATGLVAFGASETMDSALTVEVLEALLIRGGEHSKPGRVRGVSADRSGHAHTYIALQSLDLCGCVSPVFDAAMRVFVQRHLGTSGRAIGEVPEEDEESPGREERGRTRLRSSLPPPPRASLRGMPAAGTPIPSLQRLGLAGVALPRELLAPLVLAFPNLTHLDLSRTRTDAAMLASLGRSHVRLESLSLSRCRALTSESITQLLVYAPAAANLVELSLEGTLLFPTPLSREDLRLVLTQAPCMLSGRLRYLDLSGCPVSDAELALMCAQPALLDLGLSSCPYVSLGGTRELLLSKAPNVQVLDLSHAAGATVPTGCVHAVHLYHELIAPCTEMPHALAIAKQLRQLGISDASTAVDADTAWRAPTNLRVIELANTSLNTVRGGLGSWKVIMGAGRRGWVVDTAAAPDPSAQNAEDAEAAQPPEPLGPYEERGRSPRTRDSSMPRLTRTMSQHAPLARGLSVSPEPRGRSKEPHAPLARGRSTEASALARGRSVEPRMPIMAASPGRPPLRRAPSGGRAVQEAPPNSSALVSRSLSLSARRAPAREDAPQRAEVRREVIRGLGEENARRRALEHLSAMDGTVPGSVGWHSHKMEVLLGYGLLGREIGNYAWLAYQTV